MKKAKQTHLLGQLEELFSSEEDGNLMLEIDQVLFQILLLQQLQMDDSGVTAALFVRIWIS